LAFSQPLPLEDHSPFSHWPGSWLIKNWILPVPVLLILLTPSFLSVWTLESQFYILTTLSDFGVAL
jgi:hypothetical protein